MLYQVQIRDPELVTFWTLLNALMPLLFMIMEKCFIEPILVQTTRNSFKNLLEYQKIESKLAITTNRKTQCRKNWML